MDELIRIFDLNRIQKSSGIFDEVKLRWFNHEHIKRLSLEEFKERYNAWARLVDGRAGEAPDLPDTIWELLKNGSQTFGDAKQSIEGGAFDFLNDDISYAPDLLSQGAKADAATVKTHLSNICELLGALAAEDFTHEAVKDAVFPYATKQGRASVLWPMRAALSGKEKSPDPFTLSSVLGKEKTLARIEKAVAML